MEETDQGSQFEASILKLSIVTEDADKVVAIFVISKKLTNL